MIGFGFVVASLAEMASMSVIKLLGLFRFNIYVAGPLLREDSTTG
jgi:hypothetical protein